MSGLTLRLNEPSELVVTVWADCVVFRPCGCAVTVTFSPAAPFFTVPLSVNEPPYVTLSLLLVSVSDSPAAGAVTTTDPVMVGCSASR